jgi:hypothetical protein
MSTRRAARASTTASVDGLVVPRELADPDHPVWRDRDRCLRFLRKHGLEGGEVAGDWLDDGPGTHPHNRRNHASAEWGLANGITAGPNHADWNQLRVMGLIG